MSVELNPNSARIFACDPADVEDALLDSLAELASKADYARYFSDASSLNVLQNACKPLAKTLEKWKPGVERCDDERDSIVSSIQRFLGIEPYCDNLSFMDYHIKRTMVHLRCEELRYIMDDHEYLKMML